VFHFSFNQNKLWINWRILDHVYDAYVACVSLFGHLFWNKRSFWQQCQIISRHICKLSANDRRQTETLLHHVSLAAVSRKHNWMDCGRLCLTLCSRSLLQTVLEMIGRNPGMLFAVRLDVWNRFRRCTSLMWLSRRRDVTRGRSERLRSLVLPDCLNRLHNDSIMLRWQPQCIAKTLWAPLNC
jgi:hypothetical protein